MVEVSIVYKTSPEANWNMQADRQAGGRRNKPVYWEAAPPNTVLLGNLTDYQWLSPIIPAALMKICS